MVRPLCFPFRLRARARLVVVSGVRCVGRDEQAVRAFGEHGMIELVTLLGFYSLVSMNLNAFEVPPMPEMEDAFSVR